MLEKKRRQKQKSEYCVHNKLIKRSLLLLYVGCVLLIPRQPPQPFSRPWHQQPLSQPRQHPTKTHPLIARRLRGIPLLLAHGGYHRATAVVALKHAAVLLHSLRAHAHAGMAQLVGRVGTRRQHRRGRRSSDNQYTFHGGRGSVLRPPGHHRRGGGRAQHPTLVAVVVPDGRWGGGWLVDGGDSVGNGVLVPLKPAASGAAVALGVVVAVAVLVVVGGVLVGGVVIILFHGRVLHPHRVVQAELRVIRRLPPVSSSAARNSS